MVDLLIYLDPGFRLATYRVGRKFTLDFYFSWESDLSFFEFHRKYSDQRRFQMGRNFRSKNQGKIFKIAFSSSILAYVQIKNENREKSSSILKMFKFLLKKWCSGSALDSDRPAEFGKYVCTFSRKFPRPSMPVENCHKGCYSTLSFQN